MTLRKEGYAERIADAQLEEMLEVFGAVCVEGPKWCGKTWLALNRAESIVEIGNPAGNFQNRQLAEINPLLVLEGKSPRLIDEWQDVPALWDAVRSECDTSHERGRFILTGSSTPGEKGVQHSGIGRIGVMRMRTMSLYESGDSSGIVSLADIMSGSIESQATGEVSLKDLIHLVVRGGWPDAVGMSSKQAQMIATSYLDGVVKTDMEKSDGVRRDERKVRMLLRSLARNESTLVSVSALRRDIAEADGENVSVDSISEYLNVLERLFIIENQPAFAMNMRSSVRVGKTVKRHFSDPSLAVAALRATPEKLMKDLNTFGFLFESMVERDLSIYAQSFGGELSHYRDGLGREIDAVIEMPDGSWGAFEVKLGANQIDAAAQSLKSLANDMEQDPKATPPAVLCVICGTAVAVYTRPDGVMVVPITALRN